MANGVVMNDWGYLCMFTDAELAEHAELLKSELKKYDGDNAYAVELHGELHWTEWHLKNRNREEHQNGSE